jgi:hypothetical protein
VPGLGFEGIEPDALPGLGLVAATTGRLQLWLSTTGSGEPTAPASVRLQP